MKMREVHKLLTDAADWIESVHEGEWPYHPFTRDDLVERLRAAAGVQPSQALSDHVCGMQGYNGMIDPPCPGCERNRKAQSGHGNLVTCVPHGVWDCPKCASAGVQETAQCPDCNGYGRVNDGSGARSPYSPKCPKCGGSGRVPAGPA
jgi:hypothetical protein